MTSRIRRVLWACGVVIALVAVAAIMWVRHFHEYTPVEALQDLQAAARVGPAPRPVERFLELRYGSLTNSANRQKAFLDFFNVGHIKGLSILVNLTPGDQKQRNINAMAQWVADYRTMLTPEEKAALGAYVRSASGHDALQRATAQYLREDAHFRARTAAVVQELMTTLATVRKP